jgi:hypothetical protein
MSRLGDFQAASDFKALRHLSAIGTPICESGLAALATLPALQHLEITLWSFCYDVRMPALQRLVVDLQHQEPEDTDAAELAALYDSLRSQGVDACSHWYAADVDVHVSTYTSLFSGAPWPWYIDRGRGYSPSV